MTQIQAQDLIEMLGRSKSGNNSNALQGDIPLSEQGYDSLDIFELFLEIEERHGVHVDDNELHELETINQIVEFLNR